MEKTTTITIGGTTFSLTESAYEKLRNYLERLKKHFAQESESAEIMRDIESRIAEKLTHKKDQVITDAGIAALIAEIGEADEFDDEESEVETARSSGRKLYRDMSNAWIGGVAAGLGAYFDIDALWIRLLFLATMFFGGTGILVYIILWILIPEAKSASHKLEMQGAPVNLEGIARVVKESVEDVRESGALPRFFAALGRIIRGCFRMLGKIVGFFLAIDTFLAMIAATVGLGIIATNWNAPYNDFPLRDVVSDTLLFSGLAAGYIAIFIPLLAIFFLGIRLFRGKVVIPATIGFGLIGIWAIALCVAGTIAVKASGQFFEYQRTSPDYQTETRELDLSAFNRIQVESERITIKGGPVQQVIIEGHSIDIDRDVITVEDGILSIVKKNEPGKLCIFCRESSPDITIITPDLDDVSIENGTVIFEEYNDMALVIKIQNGSMRGTLISETLTIDAENSNIRADLTVGTFKLTIQNGYTELEGSATSATISLDNSSFQSDRFIIDTANLTTDSSYGEINTKTLQANTDDSSRIINVADDQSME